MTMNEYLAELKYNLASLPGEERDAAIKYYKEFFEEAGSDEEAIRELGSPEALAKSILAEAMRTEQSSTEFIPATPESIQKERDTAQGFGEAPHSNTQNSRNNTVLIILLLILFSPLLISVAATVFGIFVTIVMTLFGLWIACGAIVLGLTIGGAVAFAVGIGLLFLSPLEGLVAIGAGLILAGIGLLMLIPFTSLSAKAIPAVFRAFVSLLRRILNRGKVAAHA